MFNLKDFLEILIIGSLLDDFRSKTGSRLSEYKLKIVGPNAEVNNTTINHKTKEIHLFWD